MPNSLDTRRLIALSFCILAGLISLIAGILKDDSASQAIFIGVTVMAMILTILILSERMKKMGLLLSKTLNINMENGETEAPSPVAAVETVNGTATLAGSDPSLPGVLLPPAVMAARQEIHKLLKPGLTGENCAKVLAFIDGLAPVVKKHWLIVSTRASMFVPLNVFNEAEKIARKAIARPYCRQDAGLAYSILAWIVEVNKPSKESGLLEEWLKTRTSYVEKGLENFPERHSLQMSGFEVYVLHDNAEKCVRHLTVAAEINKVFTQTKLRALKYENRELFNRARNLSPELNNLIGGILKKEKKRRIMKLIRTARLTSSLLVIVAVLASFLALQTRILNPRAENGSVSATVSSGCLTKAERLVGYGTARIKTLVFRMKVGHDVFAVFSAAAKGHDVFALISSVAALGHDV